MVKTVTGDGKTVIKSYDKSTGDLVKKIVKEPTNMPVWKGNVSIHLPHLLLSWFPLTRIFSNLHQSESLFFHSLQTYSQNMP